jgi:PAS domain S-box-containing protein
MLAPPLPSDEFGRLAALRSLELLDTPAEERFDRITRIAQRLFDVPIVLVSLIDQDRQWSKSAQGLVTSGITRDISFCSYAIHASDIFVVENTLIDPRFAGNPLVTAAPNIRFYAGAPLATAGGFRIGALCLIDSKPRSFSTTDRLALRDLADWVQEEMGRRDEERFRNASQEQEAFLRAILNMVVDGIITIDERGTVESFNPAAARIFGYPPEEVIGHNIKQLMPEPYQREHDGHLARFLEARSPRVLGIGREVVGRRKDAGTFPMELAISEAVVGGRRFFTGIVRDISARRQSEQALISSEQRYAALFESAPVPMWIVDSETLGVLEVNETALGNYGYSRDEFLRLTIAEILSPAERVELQQHIVKARSGVVYRWQHVDRQGREFPVETISRAITYRDRAARFVVAVNVAAQVKAENDVQAYLLTLQRAADATQAITRQQTLDATLQETVNQARAVVGAHQAIVSLKGLGELAGAINAVSHSDKYASSRDFARLANSCGLSSRVCEANRPMRLTQQELQALPLWREAGEPVDQASGLPQMRGWLAVPLAGRDGKNIGLLQLTDKYDAGEFTLQDQYVIAELAQLASIAIENAQLLEQVQQLNQGLEEKVAERTAALGRQEAMFRALAEQAPQVIWNADLQGKVTYLNRQWYELMGGTPADWLGHKWMGAMHPDDLPALVTRWEAARQSLQPYQGMRRLLSIDGTYHSMSYRASPVLDANGKVLFWVGIDADVTEIKAIESALRLSNQELEAFSYSVSHDLRSPLNTVDGFSRLLAKQLDASTSNEKIQHYLSRIQAGAAQMGRLIEDLLSLAQVSRIQLRHETVSLSALAHEIAGECQGRNPERVARIHIENGLQAQGDGKLLRVVMENLVGNAWKFTSQRAQADIHIGHTIDAAGMVVFLVRDNGVGFDMVYTDKLFNTFQRLHAVSEFPGSGVGLATVSRVISRHGGRVWAEAAPDKGATFFFTLPGAVALSKV